ncbi:hypothetical protein [Roseovarius sp. D22-M7]|uniref:hypothetical protein n=1 Tax=Roseovarius sp. D22-M7 TaxID=3127116 RepID=UPI0030104D93
MGEVATLTNQIDELFREVQRVAAACQPELTISREDDVVLVEGKFVVWHDQGPLESYSVFIGFFRWDGCRPPQTASQCAKIVV